MRYKNLLLLVVAVLVINLPAGVSLVHRHSLASQGVEVRAKVVQQRVVGGDPFVSFTVPADLPERGDPRFTATSEVDQQTYDRARESGVVQVRVLPGSTSVWQVDGQSASRAGLWLALGADVLLLLIVGAYLRLRGRLRPTLVLLANADLEVAPGDSVLDRVGGQRYVVCGVVHELEPDAITVDVADRRVRVLLDGHHNPAGPGEQVRAVGIMVG